MVQSKQITPFTAFFAILAFILMWIGSVRCDFIKFTSTDGTSEPMSLGLGIWYYQYWSLVISVSGNFIFESCHGYPDTVDIDGAWKASRAFIIITWILAIILLVMACISLCANGPGRTTTHGWDAPLFVTTALCQGLTLLILSSNACSSDILPFLDGSGGVLGGVTFEDTCSISTGAKLTISAMVFWVCAGVTSFVANRTEKGAVEEGGDASLREPLSA